MDIVPTTNLALSYMLTAANGQKKPSCRREIARRSIAFRTVLTRTVDLRHVTNVQGEPKSKLVNFFVIASSNVDRFSKSFYWNNNSTFSNTVIIKDPTTTQSLPYTTV